MQNPLTVSTLCSVTSKSDLPAAMTPGLCVRILVVMESTRTSLGMSILVDFPRMQCANSNLWNPPCWRSNQKSLSHYGILLLIHAWTKAQCQNLTVHFVLFFEDYQCHGAFFFSQMCFTTSVSSRTFSDDIQIIHHSFVTDSS